MAGTIRDFNFITGPEASSPPTVGTPTNPEDFVTLEYADANYGAGGGGGALRWSAESGKAPIHEIEHNLDVFRFANESDQELWTLIRVPDGYVAGNQVKLRILIYSPSTSGNVFMKTTAYLVREATDAVDDETNSHASSNSQIALSTPSKEGREIEFDLTDADGEINSVDVAVGDYIKVKMYRDWNNESSADSEDTRYIISSAVPKFTA